LGRIKNFKDFFSYSFLLLQINTNKLVGGLLKEILVDKRLKGEEIKENIICIGALNPYVLKSPEQIKMVEIQINGGIKKEMQNKFKGSNL